MNIIECVVQLFENVYGEPLFSNHTERSSLAAPAKELSTSKVGGMPQGRCELIFVDALRTYSTLYNVHQFSSLI